tara:strand:- start:141 stop:320 length:180 start_codon:yes stop_codon:yes gene_type:complete
MNKVRIRIGLNCPSGSNYIDWRDSREVEVSEECASDFVQEVLHYARTIAPKWIIEEEEC